MNYLFLDIDGVLNNHNFNVDSQSLSIDYRCVFWLNQILEKYRPKIILSSAWRYMVLGGAMTCKGFEYMLRTHGVHSCIDIIGCTEKDNTQSNYLESPLNFRVSYDERAKQIQRWIIDNVTGWGHKYAIIDDLDIMDVGLQKSGPYSTGDRFFVKTNGKTGMTKVEFDLLDKFYGL